MVEPLQSGPLAHVQYTGSHVTLYTVFLRGYWRLDTLVIGASLSESHMDRKASPANYVSIYQSIYLCRGAGGILGHLRSFALVLEIYATPGDR